MKNEKAAICIDINGKGASLGDFYGIFFEDINHSADGGLYAQLVQNPSFEFCALDNGGYSPLTAWETVGDADVRVRDRGALFEKNPHFAEIASGSSGRSGLRNTGFNSGMFFEKGKEYDLSFFAKGAIGISVALEDKSGEELAASELTLSDEWQRYELSLSPSATTTEGRLGIYLAESGRIALDVVQLFPRDTYDNTLLRKDLAEALEQLRPRFMRFPGGCIVHAGDLDPESRTSCYCWKNTIGAPEARGARRNNWGYNQTLGLGYYEYFVLCEKLHCQPLPVLPAGWNPHAKQACPMHEMQPWIDDALDLIEFANGGADTPWGKVRCELGHPKPFKLKYLAIGNEEVGEEFPVRFAIIAKAVKEKYPNIKLIHSAGPFPAGSEYDRGYKAARETGAELIDEHYYASPQWLLANIDRYKAFSKRKPRVFLGEYASKGNKQFNAVVEAAYLTALENSAHAVALTCYAPLLCNVDYCNWNPNLIYFDNHRVCRTANYYVQQLFSSNLGDHLLPVEERNIGKTSPLALPILGELELVSDGIRCSVSDARVENLDNGDVVELGSFELNETTRHSISEINLSNCEFSFKFKKTGGKNKGLIINFGKTDEKNRLCWFFGGWENQDCSIASFVDGRDSILDQHMFSMETDREYELKLRIENRSVTTVVDGKVMNKCTDKIAEIRDIYVTASKVKKTGEVIIKAANVKEEPFKATVNLGKGEWEATVTVVAGDKDAENTFEREEITPKATKMRVGSSFEFEFPPMSAVVIRLSE